MRRAGDACLTLLRLDGVLVNAGISAEASSFHVSLLGDPRRIITSTKNGSIRQNQAMLDFCAQHGIGAEIETNLAGLTARRRAAPAGRLHNDDVEQVLVLGRCA